MYIHSSAKVPVTCTIDYIDYVYVVYIIYACTQAVDGHTPQYTNVVKLNTHPLVGLAFLPYFIVNEMWQN